MSIFLLVVSTWIELLLPWFSLVLWLVLNFGLSFSDFLCLHAYVYTFFHFISFFVNLFDLQLSRPKPRHVILTTTTTEAEEIRGAVDVGQITATQEDPGYSIGPRFYRGRIIIVMGLGIMLLVMMNVLFLNLSFQRLKKHYQGRSYRFKR